MIARFILRRHVSGALILCDQYGASQSNTNADRADNSNNRRGIADRRRFPFLLRFQPPLAYRQYIKRLQYIRPQKGQPEF